MRSTNDTAAVKAKVRRSGFRSSLSELLVSATVENSAPLPHHAIATATAPPVRASSTASVSSCRMTRDRLAPMAMRMLISRRRAEPRASNRLARLAQAMSRTTATMTISTVSGSRILSAQLTSNLLAGGERQVGGGNGAPIVRRDFSPALLRQRLPEENSPAGFGLFEAAALL